MDFLGKVDRQYNKFFRKAKAIVYSYKARKRARKFEGKLTKGQLQQINDFYAPYMKVSPVFHAYYTKRRGEFFSNYLPNDLYRNYIDKYYNDAKKAVVLENKCYFKKMFPDMKQADTVCYRLNGFWFAEDDTIITFEKAQNIVAKENTVVVKQAVGSSGGHAVSFVEGNAPKKFVEIVGQISEDIIVQRPIKQHAVLSRINESSVNTIRVVSLLREEGVTVYSTVLRMGTDGAKVDNVSSGGVSCGIREDGRLREKGYTRAGKTYSAHPTSGVIFGEVQIPSYEKILYAVKRLHPQIPHFRLVSWDFSIDENGEPVLIEANLNCGGIDVNQMNNGPLFGEDTKKVLDEVFGKR